MNHSMDEFSIVVLILLYFIIWLMPTKDDPDESDKEDGIN